MGEPTPATPASKYVAATVAMIAGAYFYAVGAGLLPIPGGPSNLDGPLWLLLCVGLAFFFAGVAIIIMGLHFLGVFRIGMLYREARLQVGRPAGAWGAYVMGLAFAFGWTPCIGPILAAILAVAGSETSVGHGALLLGVYSAGLGIPFVLAAFAMRPLAALMSGMRARFALVERTMGVLLVLTGFGFLAGWITDASFWLLETFPALARLG